eukprot:TRINITY_DN30007_c0_g1_i1.p1 TRINITY_DN30007_c0_g1~~TRINITY_DN30007_c0_g1_i1.p1  ORF type:complete len:170 (-),score=52.99 TRINITY_DN30007_c0_g1_i1:83-592(-)
MLLLNLLSSLFLVSRTASFVIRENTIEEEGTDLVEKQEVRVTYGDELENILRKAASEGRKSLVEEILNGEIQALQSWVRKRAFDYMEQGVSKMGEDIEAAKKVIDEIKVVLEETNSLLSVAGHEISSFLKDADFREESTSETLVNVLKFLRSVGETAENKYKKAVADKV